MDLTRRAFVGRALVGAVTGGGVLAGGAALAGGAVVLGGCSGSNSRRTSGSDSRSSSGSSSQARPAGPSYDETRAGPIVLRVPRGGSGDVSLPSQAETGWRWARAAWPTVAPPAVIVVWAPTTQAQFVAWGGSAAESGSVAAAARSDGSVILDPRLSSEVTATGMSVVLAHEFSHVLLHQATDSVSPRWLVEGSAVWAAFRLTGRDIAQLCPRIAAQVKAGAVPDGPPPDTGFEVASAPGASTTDSLENAYESAFCWCSFLISVIGVARWRQLVESGPQAPVVVDRRLRTWTGRSTAGLHTAYGEWIRGQFA